MASSPDDVEGDVGIVQLHLHAVVVERDNVVQLGHGDVDVGVVTGVQRDAAHADAVGEEQVGLGAVFAGAAVRLQKDARGTGARGAVGPRQAEVGAAAVPPAALVEAYKNQLTY